MTEEQTGQNLVSEVTFIVPFWERVLLLAFGKLMFRIIVHIDRSANPQTKAFRRVVVPDWFERAYLFVHHQLHKKPERK